jgi:glycosyltransferase involved in cell wall biosynthesis
MTVPSDQPAAAGQAEGAVATAATAHAERWATVRSEAHAAQEAAMPRGRVFVSCAAPFGSGGLGHHLEEIVKTLDRLHQPHACVCAEDRADASVSRPPSSWRTTAITPVARFSPGWRIWKERVEFDTFAASRLTAAEHLIAFNRQALAQFQAARAASFESLSLMTGSPHVGRVARQHARAYEQYPIERSFGTHIVRRYLTEYEQAQRIYVASRYTWESFVEHGVAEDKLALFPLTPDPRYTPDPAPRQADTFNIVYVGAISVAKGVPLLIEAIAGLPHDDIRLSLIGGWKTRGMRRFIEQARARDPRISVSAGDPLPHYRTASLCVHPTYEDGFAYAPAEALACGVPAIVSADTGMQELIEPGSTGLVVATGEPAALAEAIEAVYRGEILSG